MSPFATRWLHFGYPLLSFWHQKPFKSKLRPQRGLTKAKTAGRESLRRKWFKNSPPRKRRGCACLQFLCSRVWLPFGARERGLCRSLHSIKPQMHSAKAPIAHESTPTFCLLRSFVNTTGGKRKELRSLFHVNCPIKQTRSESSAKAILRNHMSANVKRAHVKAS